VKTLLFATIASLSLGVTAVAEDYPPNFWQWSCSTLAFYGMDVTPDGNYKPFGENRPAKITIKLINDKTDESCQANHYHFEIDDNSGLFSAQPYETNSCTQLLQLHKHTTSELENAEGIVIYPRQMTVVITRDDNDWRFVLSKTHLSTTRSTRMSKIEVPQVAQFFTPEARVNFVTGECIMQHEGEVRGYW
jgi:hypothetical protein